MQPSQRVCIVDCFFFFFNDTATTEIYTLSLHDALPISVRACAPPAGGGPGPGSGGLGGDRKSTRLNSSHANISYAVFCLKKKKNEYQYTATVPWLLPQVTAYRSTQHE